MTARRAADRRKADWLPYLAVAGAIALMTIAVTVTEILREADRQDERALARTESATRLLSHQLQGVFSKIELSLSTLTFQYAEGRGGTGAARETSASSGAATAPRPGGVSEPGAGPSSTTSPLDRLLISQKALLPEIEYLRITDAQGVLRASSQPLPVAPVSVADLALFTRTREAPDSRLVVTGPFVGRVSGKWVMTFSRRLVDADGRFAGVVYASISSDYFSKVFPEARIGPSGIVTLRLADTTLFYRHPESSERESALGTRSDQIAAAWQGRREGHLLMRSPVDGIERMHVFSRVGEYPFYVSVGQATADRSYDWEGVRWLVGGLATGVVLIVSGAAWVAWRSRRHRSRAEALQARSEDRLRLAMEASNDGLWEWDIRSGASYCSPAYLSMLGYEPGSLPDNVEDQLVGLLHPEDRNWVLAEAQRRLEQEGRYVIEFRLRCSDGSYKWILSRGKVVERDASGRPARAVGTHTDLTARKELELRLREANKELRAIFDAAPIGIALIRDRVVLRCNQALERILGAEDNGLTGLPTRAWFPDEEAWQAFGVAMGQALERNERHAGVQLLRRRDGTPFWAEFSAQALDPSDPHRGVVAIVTDITEKREAEAALREAKERAESSSRSKSTFLANMSHEIRTPMNAILGFAYLLKDQVAVPEQREMLGQIGDSASHLLNVLNDILDLSKIEAGKLELEDQEVHLNEILDQIVSMLSEQARVKGLTLESRVDTIAPGLRGDATRLTQALLNLANNAVKFTPAGHVRLSITAIEDRPDQALLRFEVEDSGVGIPAEAQSRLFQVFQQADDSTTRRFGGTGLGLAITKRLAHQMGGEVGVRSAPGEGSTFWFTARLRRRADAAGAPAGRPEDASPTGAQTALEGLRSRHAGARVLLVEDDRVNQRVARALLTRAGLEVDVADDGAAALDAVGQAEDGYALVLMDQQMPKLDGLEATRRLRRMPAGANLPIIAMTASAFQEDRDNCREAGMDDFVPKPVDPERLYQAVLRWLDARA
ncbi:MAG: hypothetical protein RIS35_3777 [Pseudomonadota bacterium]|jgi:PAS domain S-box-containing protein